jgi:alpha-1,3-glucan synthase
MSSAEAWQLHGCYKVGSEKYNNFPVDSALYGCMDDNISLDHRDPTHPVRGIIKMMSAMRQSYPVLNDGFYLRQLSNKTYDVYLPGSNGIRTETGLWSVSRARFNTIQDLSDTGQGNQTVWMIFQNDDHTINYSFNCSDDVYALVSPFDEGTIVKNLFPPFEEYHLRKSSTRLGLVVLSEEYKITKKKKKRKILIMNMTRLEGSKRWNGCLQEMTLTGWGFKALVPKDRFVGPPPFITRFVPGHDMRIPSTTSKGDRVPINFQFSEEMDCDSITQSISITSTTSSNRAAELDKNTIRCGVIPDVKVTALSGTFPSTYNYSVELVNVFHGIHKVIVDNPTDKNRSRTTNVRSFALFTFEELMNLAVHRSFHVSHRVCG